MSRGHGQVQETILATVNHWHALDRRIVPVRCIARDEATRTRRPYTRAMASSYRRAANRLCDDGELDPLTLHIPTTMFLSEAAMREWAQSGEGAPQLRPTASRGVSCVTLPDADELDEDDWRQAAVSYLQMRAGTYDDEPTP
jgi:hypothetical protein